LDPFRSYEFHQLNQTECRACHSEEEQPHHIEGVSALFEIVHSQVDAECCEEQVDHDFASSF
jgi:hypothetical protein